MGEDGLAPRALGAVHARYRTPALAILVMAGWSAILVLALALLSWWEMIDPKKTNFDSLTDFTQSGAMHAFQTLVIPRDEFFVFRAACRTPQRPYRCLGYPVVPALYLILPALVLGNMFVNEQLEALGGPGSFCWGQSSISRFTTVRSANRP